MRRLERAHSDETVGIFGGAAKGGRGKAADPDRRPWFLNRLRREASSIDFVVFAFEGNGLAFPEATNDFQRFIGAATALLARNREAFEFLDLIASTHSQLE